MILAGLFITGCWSESSMPKKPSKQEMAALTPPLSLVRRNVNGYQISFVIRNAQTETENKPSLFFVHGSPGAWHDWLPFLTTNSLTGFGVRIAVDRPGFGDSQAGGIITDARAQAAMLAALIPDQQPTVLVGHSLGGALIGWMALDFPDKICAVISIAGSLSAELEHLRWYNHIANMPPVRFFLSKALNNSNLEMLSLQSELTRLESQWYRLKKPIWLIQGEKDKLVNPRTVEKISPSIPEKYLRVIKLPNAGHFIIWKDPQRIINILNEINCTL